MQEHAQPKYFDLHITGLGYLNRVRELPVKRGQPFLAVDISALHGEIDNVEYTRFDCRVSGKEAQAIVRELMPAVEQGKKVLVGFKLGDLYGETGVSLKARLLKIDWAKVDGQPFALPSTDQGQAA
jgi:hypothetical protein